jgi:2,4-dienoyl-CoA reductase-like NADH-dependent reductase (Old Yellow Enzyme family)
MCHTTDFSPPAVVLAGFLGLANLMAPTTAVAQRVNPERALLNRVIAFHVGAILMAGPMPTRSPTSSMEAPDAVEVARMVVAAGADIVDVSAGQTVPEAKPVYGRQFQTPFSDRIRHEARVPTMTVGNISSPADVNTILAAGRADLVVLARAHLWDPYWTRHAAADLGHTLPWPPSYATLDRYTPRLR